MIIEYFSGEIFDPWLNKSNSIVRYIVKTPPQYAADWFAARQASVTRTRFLFLFYNEPFTQYFANCYKKCIDKTIIVLYNIREVT